MADTGSAAVLKNLEEFDDVEEFHLGDHGQPSMSREQFDQVFGLVQQGNRAFRESMLREAITLYSKARLSKECEPVVLSNRSAAFCRFSEQLRNRAASLSEYQPLDGLDPTTYAELALKDAQKVMPVRPNSAKVYYLKAKALILLERYDEARETIILGLQIDPLCIPLQRLIQNLEKITASSERMMRGSKLQKTDDFDCTLCFKLLYDPVTTPCGHSFCRPCLLQSMDHGNKCPMCRTVLFISPKAYPVSVTLKNIIQKHFADEYAERKSELESLVNMGSDVMPLFVMDVVIPGQKLSLNIFEPRYRLMVRRIMEGNRRMGMVGIDPSTGLVADFACEVEICECEPLPDGRFYLEVEGRRRFQICRVWDQDGYRVAEVEWIQDIYPSEMAREREDLDQLVKDTSELVRNWVVEARQVAHSDRRIARASLVQVEALPRHEHPEQFSFWLVNLLSLRPSDRLELLRLRDTRERISRALVHMRAEELSCRVQ